MSQPSTKHGRRGFLKLSVVAGAAGMSLPTLLSAASKPSRELPPKGLVFLFQGDSITDGNRGRNDDPNHILGHGYCFAVASRMGADFPEQQFQFINRGVSGNTVTDLANRWQADALDLKPNVLSILVGINDVNALVEGKPDAQNVEAFDASYRKLLSDSRAQNPELLIVLGLPFFVASGWRKDFYEQWHPLTLERAEVVKRLATDFDAVLVDYPQVFEEAQKRAPIDYWIWDGVHPTVFGHELMAREWIKQVSTRLQFLKFYEK